MENASMQVYYIILYMSYYINAFSCFFRVILPLYFEFIEIVINTWRDCWKFIITKKSPIALGNLKPILHNGKTSVTNIPLPLFET
jgi:hypothetical protein